MPLDALVDEPDDVLLARAAQGDARAAETLTHRLTPRVFAHASRVLGDRAEAEDVAQEAMLRLWRIAPKWRHGEAQVTTWLFRVTVNLCTDRLRRSRRNGPALDDVPEPPDPAPSGDAQLMKSRRAAALEAALLELPERQRQAVVLRHIEGLSNPEIAAAMDIGVEAVESLTARGKRKLAGILGQQRDELGFGDE